MEKIVEKMPRRRRRTKVGRWLAVGTSLIPIIVEIVTRIYNKVK